MEKNYELEYDFMRMKLWSDVAAATASANNCTSKATITNYAESALMHFDREFKRPKNSDYASINLANARVDELQQSRKRVRILWQQLEAWVKKTSTPEKEAYHYECPQHDEYEDAVAKLTELRNMYGT